MRRAIAFVVMLALVAGADAAQARSQAPRTCRAELGAAEAQALVRDCRESDPATPALCRPETPCEAMREMIAEACRVQAEDKPVCQGLRQDDEDEDDE